MFRLKKPRQCSYNIFYKIHEYILYEIESINTDEYILIDDFITEKASNKGLNFQIYFFLNRISSVLQRDIFSVISLMLVSYIIPDIRSSVPLAICIVDLKENDYSKFMIYHIILQVL